MKVLVASHSLAQMSTHARWRILAERYGIEVHLAVPAEWRFSSFGGVRSIRAKPRREPGFHVHPLRVWQRGTGNNFLFTEGLRLLASLQPDIVYVAQDWGSWSLHQILGVINIASSRSAIWGFSSCMERIEPHSWRSRLLWRRYCSKVIRAKTYSKIGARVLRESGYLGAIDVETEIGVDLDTFRPNLEMREKVRAQKDLRGFVIGFAGRLVDEKGVLDLLKSCEDLSGDWSLLIIGDGPLRSDVEAAAARNALANRARIVGYVPHTEVADLIQACDTLVLPSKVGQCRFIEQFGLILAQAMACGVPVVGSDNGAIPEIVGDPRRIFPEGDVASLTNILTELQKKPSYRKEASKIGLERVSRLYSASALADSFQRSLNQHRERA